MTFSRTILQALACCLTLPVVSGADWTSWRGPSHIGVASDSSYPSKWSAKNVRWTVRLPGYGISSPVVSGDRVFVTTNLEEDKSVLHVVCVDQLTGTILWDNEYWGGGNTASHPWTGMSAPVPVTDGEHVYTVFGTGDVFCHDVLGNLVWVRSLVRDYGQYKIRHGLAASPILYENLLIALVDQEGKGNSYIIAMDKTTGKTVYKRSREGNTAWSSPILVEVGGEAQLVTSADRLLAYQPGTGKVIWEAKAGGAYCTPVVAGNLVISVDSRRRSVAVRLGGQGEISDTHIEWATSKGSPRMPSAVSDGKYYYTIKDDGLLTRLDVKSGELVWQERLGGDFTASPVIAGGKVYLVSHTGETIIFKAGMSKFKQVAKTPAVVNDRFIASPAFSDGQIFLRGDKYLVCIGKKK